MPAGMLWGLVLACRPEPGGDNGTPGTPDDTSTPTPTPDTGLDSDSGLVTDTEQTTFGWIDVDAFGDVTCGIRRDPDLRLDCWGDPSSPLVIAAPPAGEYVDVDVGDGHACALDLTGTITCWGADALGQATAPIGSGFRAISAGAGHTCAIDVARDIQCWGDGSHGELEFPADVYISVSVGTDHSCAIADGRQPLCVGSDTYGESSGAAAEFSDPYTPVITAGNGVTCGVTSNDNQTDCIGDDRFGLASAFVSDDYRYNVAIAIDDDYVVVLGGFFFFISDIHGWGSGVPWVPDEQTPGNFHGLPFTADPYGGQLAVAAGADHVCAMGDGTLYCTGSNELGQLDVPP